jgi:hypothetical protein
MIPMIFEKNCYRLVPPRDGIPGYEVQPVYVVADSLGAALAIADARYIGYEVQGIVIAGRVFLDVHKLPEAQE